MAKVYITTPFPTRDELIAHLGISKARVAEIDRWLDEYYAKEAKRAERKVKRSNGARKRVASRAKKK